MKAKRAASLLLACGSALAATPAGSGQAPASEQLAALVAQARAVQIERRDPEGQRQAAAQYRELLAQLDEIEAGALGLDDQVDHDLLRAHLRTRIFEYEDLQLDTIVPIRWFALGATDRLFIRPGAVGAPGVRAAIRELQELPRVLETAAQVLTRPAREWTLNAIAQAHYAKLLLQEHVPQSVVGDPELQAQLVAAAAPALAAVERYERWMREVLLPRSDRPPTWTTEQIDFYQLVHEQLEQYPAAEMLRVAEQEEAATWAEMEALAQRIRPDGDLRAVWESMKDEAPPWEGVLPMAQRFVDMAAQWLRTDGAHVVTIPDTIDYGARITSPMARRTLSFGGATIGPTVAGRHAGYYVLTPLESTLTPEEAASRIRSYNPYWTHVISYHEWLGHVIQLTIDEANVTRPMRQLFDSIYFSQAWSFYLEKLLEDEGYYEDRLDYTSALRTRMARLQMRMWRIQRILTKIRMARDELTFEQAVQVYVDRIGMEPTNAYIEVQRDSQSPSPPGREIIGERMILGLRAEYRQRMGPHYSLRNFNDTLLTYGSLPFRQIRRLMFRE